MSYSAVACTLRSNPAYRQGCSQKY